MQMLEWKKVLPIIPEVHIAPKRQVKFKMNLIKMPEHYMCFTAVAISLCASKFSM